MNFHPSILLISLLLLPPTHTQIITSPPPRSIGPTYLSHCNETNIDSSPSTCDPKFCNGLQLGDNLANIQNWISGQEVKIRILETIPHKGWVNVGIIDNKTEEDLQLMSFDTRSWDGYVNRKGVVDRVFFVRVPELGSRCLVPGECVLRWSWLGRGGPGGEESWESCVDFVVKEEVYDGEGEGSREQKVLPIEEGKY